MVFLNAHNVIKRILFRSIVSIIYFVLLMITVVTVSTWDSNIKRKYHWIRLGIFSVSGIQAIEEYDAQYLEKGENKTWSK